MTIPYAARLPDHVDNQGFPWWDEDDDYAYVEERQPGPFEIKICCECGANLMGGICTYDSEHWVGPNA